MIRHSIVGDVAIRYSSPCRYEIGLSNNSSRSLRRLLAMRAPAHDAHILDHVHTHQAVIGSVSDQKPEKRFFWHSHGRPLTQDPGQLVRALLVFTGTRHFLRDSPTRRLVPHESLPRHEGETLAAPIKAFGCVRAGAAAWHRHLPSPRPPESRMNSKNAKACRRINLSHTWTGSSRMRSAQVV